MSLFLIIKLVFISDIDIYQFVEKVARGGLSYISQGYRKSNNKYMKSFDKVKPSKYILYEDPNNLYG